MSIFARKTSTLFRNFVNNNANISSQVLCGVKGSRAWSSEVEIDEKSKAEDFRESDDYINPSSVDLQPQGVNPKKGWAFRGVHKAILSGRVGQAPVQKMLKNGRNITIFTVGTGGMFDFRTSSGVISSKPIQWHRVVVHNESLGSFAVQQLCKSSAVFVEGEIETRVYNDSISGEVKNIAEICIRHDGRVRLVKTGGMRSPGESMHALQDGLSAA